jgi:hypothetical protein
MADSEVTDEGLRAVSCLSNTHQGAAGCERTHIAGGAAAGAKAALVASPSTQRSTPHAPVKGATKPEHHPASSQRHPASS